MGHGGKEIGADNKFKWLINIGDRNIIKYKYSATQRWWHVAVGRQISGP